AHTWVERAYVTNEGALIGDPGFTRGNVPRTQTFTDDTMTYRLPPPDRTSKELSPQDLVCKETQQTQNYTVESPMLIARANDSILLMYQENGHVTLIGQDTAHNSSGSIIIYGTSNSSATDNFQALQNDSSHFETLGRTDFDDGHCYQDNSTPLASERRALPQRQHLDVEGNALWCTSEISLPETLMPGSTYTLYWVWYFNGPSEVYTSCLDVSI
ncbi:hypothetical protein EJ04DRAFT_393094, partial [Polyplosphaeria fusca]